MGTIFLVILLFHIQYKTHIAEACDYFRNSTLDEIARWKKYHGCTAPSTKLTTGLNCTRLRLEQLLAYCRVIFFQIALKPMWLPIQIASLSY